MATYHNLGSLGQQLGRLERSNLIRLADVQPELAYVFRHEMIQESAYQSLLHADRRRVHRAAGQALEALLGGGTPSLEMSLQLARHFEEAGDDGRARHYYRLAGDAALAQYANTEAVAAYTRALASAERSPTEIDTWQHLFSCRGRALELNSHFDEALANYQAMSQRAEMLGNRRLALVAAVAIGQLYATATPLFDPSQAEHMAETALAEARSLGDESAEAKILWNQLNLYRFTQRNPQARLKGEQSLEIANRLGLKEQAALSLNDLIHVYGDLALWAEAHRAATDAGRLWHELDNIAMLADSLSTIAFYDSLQGNFANALSQAQEARRLSVSIGNLWGQSYSCSSMGWSYWYTGQPDRAIEMSEAGLRFGRLAGYQVADVLDQERLGYMLGELGDTPGALARLAQAEAATMAVGGIGLRNILSSRIHLELQAQEVEKAAATLQYMESAMQTTAIWEVDGLLRSRSEVALAQGDVSRALTVTQARITELRKLGLLVHLPEALIGLAQAQELLGHSQGARAHLIEAHRLAEQMQASMLEWRVLYALGEFEARHGQPAAASAAWDRAREIVSAIAARVPSLELQASFRARPDLRALLGEAAPPAL